MRNKFIITESEREKIRGLYEQQPTQITPQIQGSFKYTEQGINPYVIINVSGMNAQQIYETTLNWIKTTYKNPDRVIKTTIPNQKIRIEESSNIGQVKNITYPLFTTIEISFKDGKLKFEPLEVRNPQSDPSQDINLIKFPDNVPEEGLKVGGIRFKKEKIIDNLNLSMTNLQDHLNFLLKTLVDFFSKKEDW